MPQTVYTLLCKRDMPMAAITLPLIARFLQDDQQLVVFDDGSFDAATVREVKGFSAKIEVLTLAERDAAIQNELKNYKNCLQYWRDFPFAFKLLDIPLIAKNTQFTRYTYTDADIIYLKNCEGYFSREVNTYLMTDAIKLSVKLKDIFFKYGWKVPYHFNAGYLSFDAKDIDLDFIEYFLGLPDVRNIPWVSEQTCWALLFGRAGKTYTPLTSQFVCREDFTGPQPDTLAIHLIAKLKSNCKAWASTDLKMINDIQPQFMPGRNVNIIDWAQKSIKRYFPK